MTLVVEVCSHIRATLGECAVWDSAHNRLLYLDVAAPAILEFNPESHGLRRIALPLEAPLGGLCLRNDGVAVFCQDGVIALKGTEFRPTEVLVPPHASFAVAPPNDVTTHPDGFIVLLTAERTETRPVAGVFVVSDHRAIQQIADGFVVGNGPVFGLDGRSLFVSDSGRGLILQYEWNARERKLTYRRIFATVPKEFGLPDGAAIDSESCLWSTRWDGGCVVRYDANGVENFKISLPARRVTSCAFGGRTLSTLYITTARAEADNDLGGHLLRVDMPVTGRPAAIARI